MLDAVNVVILAEILVIAAKISGTICISEWNQVMRKNFVCIFKDSRREVLLQIGNSDIVRADNCVSEAAFPTQLMHVILAAQGRKSDLIDFASLV